MQQYFIASVSILYFYRCKSNDFEQEIFKV
ncbi:MAG: hypothetical protein JWQ54_3249 [Mucilaginibacter sp.]|jgi:hypothetical protein|nr:hypothetical protein [Mucilaginibacter sp.]